MNEEVAYTFEGKDVEEAVEKGLRALGLSRDDVHIEVLDEGSKGFLGFGATPARVKLVPKSAPEPAKEVSLEEEQAPAGGVEALAQDILTNILHLLGFDANVETYWTNSDDRGKRALVLNIKGKDLGLLIGRQSETLLSLQYLMRAIINQQTHQWLNIVVDVENYRRRREESLKHLALRMAEQVARTGRPVVLEAMPANERRIIHIALRDHPDVYTVSVGREPRRKVTIRPKSELKEGASPPRRRYGRRR